MERMKKAAAILAILVIASATLLTALPGVRADMTQSILGIVTSIKTVVNRIDSNVNKVKVETIITGSANVTGPGMRPFFNISGNQMWDFLAVYVSTKGVNFNETLNFGTGFVGARFLNTTELSLFGADTTDFPIFASDIFSALSGGTHQSMIPVPPNVHFAMIANHAFIVDGYVVSFKIVIERPIDPSFQVSATFGAKQ